MNKKVNFCIDCKFCSHHKQEITGWSYYCTNPKTTLHDFVNGNVNYVACRIVRSLDTVRLTECWKKFIDGDNLSELKEKYKSNKDVRYCPLYRKKLTFIRLIKYYIIKLWRKL